jgi:hypothetical protein
VAVRGAQVGEPTHFAVRRLVVGGQPVSVDAAATVVAGDSIPVELTFEYTTTSATANYVVAAAPSWVSPREGTVRVAGLPRPVRLAWQTVRFVLPPASPGHRHVVLAFGAEDSADHLMSATNWTVGPPVWGDGNDLAELSETQVQMLRRAGRVWVDRYLFRSYQGRLAQVKFGTEALFSVQTVVQPRYDRWAVLGGAIELTVTPRSSGGR